MPGCVIILPKMVSERLDLSFGIFARRGEKYSCYAIRTYKKTQNKGRLKTGLHAFVRRKPIAAKPNTKGSLKTGKQGFQAALG